MKHTVSTEVMRRAMFAVNEMWPQFKVRPDSRCQYFTVWNKKRCVLVAKSKGGA